MSTKKILAFTGIRSDYDLMSGLYKKLSHNSEYEFGLIVAGAHLSQTYGKTVRYIEDDDINILAKLESLIDSDSPSARLMSSSILLQNAIHVVEQFAPDCILIAGDREDAMMAALIGAYLSIPTIHFFGGDHSPDGNVDNQIRHAISKLASVHFVAHDSHAKRLEKMGESKERIFFIGSPSLDKFVKEEHIDKQKLLMKLERPTWKEYALLIFHPILGDHSDTGSYFENILLSLKRCNINAFVSYPNIDVNNKQIINVINKYKDDNLFCFYTNFSRKVFVNLMRNAKFMIGNSSSGLYEAPFVKLGVVNVGKRQLGRFAANNVLFVNNDTDSIINGIHGVTSHEFMDQLKSIESPYGDGSSVDKALKLISSLNFEKFIYKNEDVI